MVTEKKATRWAIIKELYVGLVGWAWIATCLASVYFLVGALFFKGSWLYFVLSAIAAWLLYRLALYYQLQTEGRISPLPSDPWTAPPEETYYLKLENGGTRRVRMNCREDVESFVRDHNARAGKGDVIVRVFSQSLQKQRLATGRDGAVWPDSVPVFYVHFSDGVVSELNLEPTEVESWAQKWRSFGEVVITEVCDNDGYVIWPERDGSRIF